jgi:hypothetical protein
VNTPDIKSLTAYQDVNDVLVLLADGLQTILKERLVGLYLTGSLTYGDFDRGSSDIDFLAVLTEPMSDTLLHAVEDLHSRIGGSFPEWAKRIEGSYITKAMLSSDNPPVQPRPYINNAAVISCQYGNEWVLNRYVLHECGVALVGPPANELFQAVNVQRVREFSRKDLHDNWVPKLTDPQAFVYEGHETGHLQAYAVLTMCRILHRDKNEQIASKRVASAWVKQTYPAWDDLVTRAEQWRHGQALASDDEVKAFIKFTLNEVG